MTARKQHPTASLPSLDSPSSCYRKLYDAIVLQCGITVNAVLFVRFATRSGEIADIAALFQMGQGQEQTSPAIQ